MADAVASAVVLVPSGMVTWTTSEETDDEGSATLTFTAAWFLPMIVVVLPEPSTNVAELGALGITVNVAVLVFVPSVTWTVCPPYEAVGTVKLTPLCMVPSVWTVVWPLSGREAPSHLAQR